MYKDGLLFLGKTHINNSCRARRPVADNNKNKNNSYEPGLHDDNKALLLPRSILLSHPAPLHKENVARKMRQSIGKGKQDLDSFSQKCFFLA